MGLTVQAGGISVIGNSTITGTLGSVVSYNGLVVTPNTGVITTGTWHGTAIDHAYLSGITAADVAAGTFPGASYVFSGILAEDRTGAADAYFRLKADATQQSVVYFYKNSGTLGWRFGLSNSATALTAYSWDTSIEAFSLSTTGALTLAGALTATTGKFSTLGAFAVGDKYVIADAAGKNAHS